MRRLPLAGLALAVLLGAAGCSSEEDEPVSPPEVGLTGKVPAGLHLGLVVTLSSPPGEGAEWVAAAAGAQVATYQYELGGSTVRLDVVDDKGTAAGAEEAVRTLASRHVGGIVAATAGEHLDAALIAAASSRTAVLLPYRTQDAGLPANAWLTGSSAAAQVATMKKVIAGNGWSHVVAVTGTGRAVTDVGAATSVALGPADDLRPLLRAIRPKRNRPVTADAVVLDAPAEVQAKAAAAVQGIAPDLPIVLSRDALSPLFAPALEKAGGALSADLVAVGPDAGDLTAASAAQRADQAARFFQALRLVASSPKSKDLFGETAFAGQDADIASHDAVVALVTAAIKAKSARAERILAALDGLRVGAAAGVAGPGLDFGARVAVDADDVVPLQATPQDPGLRPAAPAGPARLNWFAVPPELLRESEG